MWGVRIGVLRSDSLALITYRSQGCFEDMDLLLLFNCNMVNGHYTGIIRSGGDVLECKKVEKSKEFDFDSDMCERRNRGDMFGQDTRYKYVSISKERYDYLCSIEKKYYRVQKAVGMEPGVGLEDTSVDVDAGSAKKGFGRPSGRDKKEVPKDIPVISKGDSICTICQVDFDDTKSLKRHIDSYHLGQDNYVCTKCGRGLLTKTGMKIHTLTHVDPELAEEESGKIKCTQKVDGKPCTKTFSTKGSLKRHILNMHGKRKILKCIFCTKFTTHTKDNLKQHIVRCADNPDKPEFWCDICPAGPWCEQKYVKMHKQEEHRW